jgi:CheY-like chemotaxis protein
MYRIILIEDSLADAELITRELEASGLDFTVTRVETETEFRHELALRRPDLILSDHGLPTFGGFQALEIARAEWPGLPFIFVSGSNNPGMVAQMFEAGATDYVFKHDLSDLKPAVLQALGVRSGARPRPELSGAVAAQKELNLQIQIADLQIPVFASGVGHLSYCPQCHRTRDEHGRNVEMTHYFGGCAECVVQSQLCAECERHAHPH